MGSKRKPTPGKIVERGESPPSVLSVLRPTRDARAAPRRDFTFRGRVSALVFSRAAWKSRLGFTAAPARRGGRVIRGQLYGFASLSAGATARARVRIRAPGTAPYIPQLRAAVCRPCAPRHRIASRGRCRAARKYRTRKTPDRRYSGEEACPWTTGERVRPVKSGLKRALALASARGINDRGLRKWRI